MLLDLNFCKQSYVCLLLVSNLLPFLRFFSDSDILFVFPFYFIISGIVFYGYRINGHRTCPFVLFLLAITMFALLQSKVY